MTRPRPRFLAHLQAALFCGAGALLGVPQLAAEETCPPHEDFDMGSYMREMIGEPVSHDDTLPAGLAGQTICYDRFCVGHNPLTRQPDWVVERINPSIACGDKKLRSGWKEEASVDPAHRATDEDYKHADYARGHNAASADFKSDRDWMKQTFVFSNAVPQLQNGFNGSYWRFLEDNVQNLALSGADLLVITGPIPHDAQGRTITVTRAENPCGTELNLPTREPLKKLWICDANDDDFSVPCPEGTGVAVPAGMFKIIHIPEIGRTFAFVMSNEDHKPIHNGKGSNTEYLERWLTSVDQIEKLTNLEFFTRTPPGGVPVDKEVCTASRWRM